MRAHAHAVRDAPRTGLLPAAHRAPIPPSGMPPVLHAATATRTTTFPAAIQRLPKDTPSFQAFRRRLLAMPSSPAPRVAPAGTANRSPTENGGEQQ